MDQKYSIRYKENINKLEMPNIKKALDNGVEKLGHQIFDKVKLELEQQDLYSKLKDEKEFSRSMFTGSVGVAKYIGYDFLIFEPSSLTINVVSDYLDLKKEMSDECLDAVRRISGNSDDITFNEACLIIFGISSRKEPNLVDYIKNNTKLPADHSGILMNPLEIAQDYFYTSRIDQMFKKSKLKEDITEIYSKRYFEEARHRYANKLTQKDDE